MSKNDSSRNVELVRPGLDTTRRTVVQEIRQALEVGSRIADHCTAAYFIALKKISYSCLEIGSDLPLKRLVAMLEESVQRPDRMAGPPVSGLVAA